MPFDENTSAAAAATDAAPAAGAASENLARFEDLGLSPKVLAAVEDLGYQNATPVQAASIPAVLAGRDLLAAAQTGTGKTAAFLLPAMNNLGHVKRARGRGMSVGCGPKMLVITPTRELAQQIDDVCTKIARRTRHTAVTVVGGVSYNPQKSALKRGCDILVATPGRLVDLIEQGACMLDEVQVLVLDEADRMLDMGFLPAVRRIVAQTPEDRQTLLFSATLDESAVGSVTDLVRDPARVEIAPATSTAETVEQYLLPVSLDAKNGVLAQILDREGSERVIIFTRTKRRADTCCRRLTRAGFSCAAIHGDRSQAQRERALKAFRQGKCDILVATDVLARGIDVTDVRYVINFDVPEEPVDYIHRIGRTGRAGEMGWALTVVTEQDIDEFYDIEALMHKTADLFDTEGIDVGSPVPAVDPDRVPADKPAGKKAKKRRRSKAEGRGRGGKARESRKPRGPRREDARDGEYAEQGDRAERPRRRVREEAVAEEPKPSRRKRPGKTRVRAEEPQRREAPEARDGRGARKGDAPRKDGRRSGRDNRVDERLLSEKEAHRPERSSKGGRGRGKRGDAAAQQHARGGREAWRNYDEPSERRGRGGRGGKSRAGRAENTARPARRGGRRPGDRGGK